MILGRRVDFVKKGGELVNLLRLNLLFDESKLEEGFKGRLKLVAIPDPPLEFVIGFHGDESVCDRVINRYHDIVYNLSVVLIVLLLINNYTCKV